MIRAIRRWLRWLCRRSTPRRLPAVYETTPPPRPERRPPLRRVRLFVDDGAGVRELDCLELTEGRRTWRAFPRLGNHVRTWWGGEPN